MPRPLRADYAGEIYHALNRGNARNKLFFKDGDYEAFERLISEGLKKYPVDLICYQWMNNHWHMVLPPRKDKAMSAFVGWVTMTHTQRYHAHNKTTGYGHVYQGRYWQQLGTTTKPKAILPSLTSATFCFAARLRPQPDCFFQKNQLVFTCSRSAFAYNKNRWRLIFFDLETDYGEASTWEVD